jgi:hypothetical protein
MQGLNELGIMLHWPGKHPQGAIAPAKLLFWQGDSQEGAEHGISPEGSQATIWLWVHAAAAAEACKALRQAIGCSSISLLCRWHFAACADILNVRFPVLALNDMTS